MTTCQDRLFCLPSISLTYPDNNNLICTVISIGPSGCPGMGHCRIGVGSNYCQKRKFTKKGNYQNGKWLIWPKKIFFYKATKKEIFLRSDQERKTFRNDQKRKFFQKHPKKEIFQKRPKMAIFQKYSKKAIVQKWPKKAISKNGNFFRGPKIVNFKFPKIGILKFLNSNF